MISPIIDPRDGSIATLPISTKADAHARHGPFTHTHNHDRKGLFTLSDAHTTAWRFRLPPQ